VRNFAEACERLRINQNYHMDSQKWADIGYNYLVVSAPGYPAVDGLIFEARGRDVVGAHCLDHNTAWVGIQVAIGGAQKPSPAALRSVRVLHDWCAAEAGHSLAKKGHKDGFATSCPGPELYAWVHAGMPFASTPGTPPVKPPVKPVTHNIALTKAVQRAVRVSADGVWGPATQTAATALISHDLRNVRYLQARVGVAQDGIWGPKSQAGWVATVKRLQAAIGVAADGAWGPRSKAAWAVAVSRNLGKS
jgi:hypothetical protein